MLFTGFEFVEPVTPVVNAVAISSNNINEGDTVTLTGSFIDPGSLSSHTVTVGWGDGSADTVVDLSVGDRAFAIPHTYLDDNPTGTPSDLNNITVTITDNDNLSDIDNSLSLTVNNLAPVIGAFASDATFDDKAEEGEPVNIVGTFTDVGVLDTHTAVVDWGDGSALEIVAVNQGAGSGTIEGNSRVCSGWDLHHHGDADR